MNNSNKEVHHHADSISFCSYNSEEILKVSVFEVTNPKSFDLLNHPSTNGVYDLRLGAAGRNEVCGTCGLGYLGCPGHVGHIKLPTVVFNPVYLSVILQILRGSCLNCHRLTCDDQEKLHFTSLLRLLNKGKLTEVGTLDEAFKQIRNTDNRGQRNAHERADLIGKLTTIADKYLEGTDQEIQVGKNIVGYRNEVIRDFIRANFASKVKRCPYDDCKHFVRPVQFYNHTRLTVGLSRKKPTACEDIEGENDRNQRSSSKVRLSDEQTIMTPDQTRLHMRELWKNEKSVMSVLFSILTASGNERSDNPTDIFFIDTLLVSPSKFRPLAFRDGQNYENQRSAVYNRVVEMSRTLSLLYALEKGDLNLEAVGELEKALINKLYGKNFKEKILNSWDGLQQTVNTIFDGTMDKLSKNTIAGVKQVLEKKEGLFRKHMMGKRVNFAARSVISPDPYLGVDEIGVPHVFAKKLTFPQHVTPWNVHELRQLVINGPEVHPGAVQVRQENGKIIMLSADQVQREAVAKQLLTPDDTAKKFESNCEGGKVVYRHIKNGDILLLNRQPTLHKPGIMAHKVRVLPKERTLRMHYSNCKTYNADFDGDEMNAHCPQNEQGRAEGYFIANVTNQYLVPKDGTPLGGLIQDHMIAGVKMTMRGRFFSRDDYYQLVYSALPNITTKLKLLPPAILKPRSLWSGKQLLSTVLINTVPKGKALISLEGNAKIGGRVLSHRRAANTLDDLCESKVIIKDGELLCGLLDKSNYGPTPFSLVHCFHQLYGGDAAGRLLSSLGRLFTHFLQINGFSLGIKDVLVTDSANGRRQQAIEGCQYIANEIAAEAFDVHLSNDDADDRVSLRKKYSDGHTAKTDTALKELDMCAKIKMDTICNKISGACIPNGLISRFPNNNLQLMVQSGAKGTTVNTMQISCLLGQIELEGRRPPLMSSGRGLPSFEPYDLSVKSRGFVSGRFLTGIRPQEYFFHCMAGREGLVDTAVKTSRSGYLQRCLIKHLEGISVSYDLTVRDSDGSVFQFLYGGDGLDLNKCSFMIPRQLPFLTKNYKCMYDPDELERVRSICGSESAEGIRDMSRRIKRFDKKGQLMDKTKMTLKPFLKFASENMAELREVYTGFNAVTGRRIADETAVDLWNSMDDSKRKPYVKVAKKCPYPLTAMYSPDRNVGAICERLDLVIESYIAKNSGTVLAETKPGMSKKRRRKMKSIDVDGFRDMMHINIMKALIEPGEVVGLLAAQSIGEPSTQMTLNTFHFAGRAEMNVTLGIPRLREILMTASKNIATPSMELTFINDTAQMNAKAETLKKQFTQVSLGSVLEKVDVTEKISVSRGGDKSRIYTIKFKFLSDKKCLQSKYCITAKDVLAFVETKYVGVLLKAIAKRIRLAEVTKVLRNEVARDHRARQTAGGGEEGEEGGTGNVAGNDDGPNGDESSDDEVDTDAARQPIKEEQDHDDDFDQSGDEGSVDSFDIKKEKNSDNEDDDNESRVGDETFNSLDAESEEENDELFQDDADAQRRAQKVVVQHTWVTEYKYDVKKNKWCKLELTISLDNNRIDLQTLVQDMASSVIVHKVPGISRAFVGQSDTLGVPTLKTEGVNFAEVFKYNDVIDMRKVYSNDMHAMIETFGIEAGVNCVIKEVKDVFKAYGIAVDERHLMLIADYMTFSGSLKAFSRSGMESNSSPIQQMSFETTMSFLKGAALNAYSDFLTSPSSCLVLGRPVRSGTGCFELYHSELKNKQFTSNCIF